MRIWTAVLYLGVMLTRHLLETWCLIRKVNESWHPFSSGMILMYASVVITDLHETGDFTWMDQSVDEAEHSIELHLPYIYKIFEG